MNRYFKVIFCLAFLVLVMEVHVPLVLCQEEAQVSLAKSVTGAIVSIDKEKSIVVVAPQKEAKAEDVSVLVIGSTTIKKNQSSASLSDLSLEDKVEVSYTTDQSGKNTAESIVVGAGQ